MPRVSSFCIVMFISTHDILYTCLRYLCNKYCVLPIPLPPVFLYLIRNNLTIFRGRPTSSAERTFHYLCCRRLIPPQPPPPPPPSNCSSCGFPLESHPHRTRRPEAPASSLCFQIKSASAATSI